MATSAIATLSNEISSWLRIAIFDQPRHSPDLFYLGTLYGRSPTLLGQQVAKILQARWRVDHLNPRINRNRYEIVVPISRSHDLLLSFSTPGNHSHRVKAQWFGAFVRSISISSEYAQHASHRPVGH